MCHHFAAVFFISLVHIFFPYSECMDAGFVAFLFELLDFFFCESHIHGSGGFFYLFYFRDANDRKGAFGKAQAMAVWDGVMLCASPISFRAARMPSSLSMMPL